MKSNQPTKDVKKPMNLAKFDDLVKSAEEYNRSNKFRRFYPVKYREGRLTTYGMYDYNSKKYVLSTPSSNLSDIFNEIEVMLKS